MKRFRQLFIRGVIAISPIVVTIYVLYYFFSLVDNVLGRIIVRIIGIPIPGIGIITSFVLILLMGFIVTNVLGAKAFDYVEKLLHRVPVIPRIYFGVKQLTDAFSLQGKQIFNKVVLIEYPRNGIYVLGFVTGESKGEIQKKTSEKLSNVFIPTTPNPTSGMLIMMRDEEIIYLDMTVEEGLKFIISAGVVTPSNKQFNK
ncbi:DUF502 domain-containing protein [Serpentinicella alkaliphila]|uniref:Putative membrane protein n=1 Tax=Serpentinicella alkaliphila TaxID=1734049 RepID=A0A4R2TIX1_9FIRM|nr:DUF502 domain-containing protein [Serpentinicella alkaliphila]QUH25567.1 DUF502 domain-containing protein [Serpentinicella alkaliphila]TCP94752.1 putative membrane protein [Serpentinicella alkaliphila]